MQQRAHLCMRNCIINIFTRKNLTYHSPGPLIFIENSINFVENFTHQSQRLANNLFRLRLKRIQAYVIPCKIIFSHSIARNVGPTNPCKMNANLIQISSCFVQAYSTAHATEIAAKKSPLRTNTPPKKLHSQRQHHYSVIFQTNSNQLVGINV